MNKENPEVTQAPTSAGWFTVFTANTIDFILLALIKSAPLYFIWNWCLSKELHLQQLSYPFFFCGFIFLQFLFYSKQREQLLFRTEDMAKHMKQLHDLTLFNLSRQLLNESKNIDNKEKVEKVEDKIA